MQNPIMSMLMNQLQAKNPQGFQVINQMMNSGGNPKEILQQMMGNTNPEQMQNIIQQAKQFGVPDNILSQLQNMK